MKKFLLSVFLLPVIAYSQAPANYYSGTENLNGFELKSKLHDIISAQTISWHYGDLPFYYGETDIDHFYDYDASNDTYLLDIYSNNPSGTTAYHYSVEQLISSAATEGLGYNREHMMPQSSFNSNYPMYSDLHFVIPTDAKINQLRSNYPYGKAGTTNYHTFTNGSKISKNGTPNSSYTGRVYEPIDEFKGDIARGLLYFSVRYEGKLNSFNYNNGSSPANDTSPLDGTEERSFEDWYIALLLQWHQQDPVSPREIERNNKVFAIQKNRNPFVDHPEWVSVIWSQEPPVITPTAPTNLSSEMISAYFVNLQWNGSANPNLLGYKIFKNGEYIGYAKTPNFTADHLTPATAYQFSVKSYYRDYSESSLSNVIDVTTLASDIYAKDLLITKYIEGTDENKALEITNHTGHAVNLNKYRISVQFYNNSSSNYYFPKPYELEGTVEHNETFVITNPKGNLTCITDDQAKFVSAAPQMSFDGSNYIELRYDNLTIDAIGAKYVDNTGVLDNVSLYRLSSVLDPMTTFDINQWQNYPVDYCQGLGTLAAQNIIDVPNGISIYPNPVVGDQLFISAMDLEKISSATIYDLSGKQVLQVNQSFKNKNFIEVSDLQSGIYILKINQVAIKFIKK